MHISAIILSAGASSRMGSDKALLKLPNGATLLEDQVRRVQAAGVGNIRIVLGHNCEKIQKACHCIAFIINSNWNSGYFSSIKCGLSGIGTGAILLPLDTVGVPPKVIREICERGLESGKNVIPTYDCNGGHPVFLRPELIKKIAAAPFTSRLDHLLQADKETLKLPVNSPNILNNINTPDEWARWISDIS